MCVYYMPYVCKYAIINCDSKIVYDTYRNNLQFSVECSMPTSDCREECIDHIQGVLHVPQKKRIYTTTYHKIINMPPSKINE